MPASGRPRRNTKKVQRYTVESFSSDDENKSVHRDELDEEETYNVLLALEEGLNADSSDMEFIDDSSEEVDDDASQTESESEMSESETTDYSDSEVDVNLLGESSDESSDDSYDESESTSSDA